MESGIYLMETLCRRVEHQMSGHNYAKSFAYEGQNSALYKQSDLWVFHYVCLPRAFVLAGSSHT